MTFDRRFYQKEEDHLIEFLLEDGAEDQVVEECEKMFRELAEVARCCFKNQMCTWVQDNGFINRFWLEQVLIDDHKQAAMLIFCCEDHPQQSLF